MNAMTLTADAGELIEARGNRIVVKTALPSHTVCDYTAPPGFPGPPLHVHPGFDETFLVLEGVLTVRVGDRVHELGRGETAVVPGAAPHTFANGADAAVRFLCVCAPGGFEEYFRAVAAGDDSAAEAVCARFGYAPA
jgi:mannose-6-phosphate isomerase-like protein (cupin superfamily)